MTSGARLFGTKAAGVAFMPGAKRAAAATSARRNPLLGKVHLAAKEMGLDDDTYRGVLVRVTSYSSAKDCSDAQLVAVLEEFKRLGWKPAQPTGRSARPRPADSPMARKARAMWISLHQLGAIANPADQALEAFATRQLKCARMQWADQRLAFRLIEALKAIGTRHGWDQDLAGVQPHATVLVLKRRLIDAQMTKLRESTLIPADWAAERTAFEFAGVRVDSILLATISDLDLVSQALGRKIASIGESIA